MRRATPSPEPASDPLPVLVEHFFEVGQRALASALHASGEVRFETGLQSFADGRLREVPAHGTESITGLFFAVVHFDTSELVGELTYGDREMHVNLLVSPRERPPGAAEFYGLWEWAAVCGGGAPVSPDRLGGDTWVVRVGRLERAVTDLASGLAALAPHIRTADVEVVAVLEAARDRQAEAWRAELLRARQKGDAERARVAFKAGEFAEVVRLLAPYGEGLGPAARMRLRLAQKALEG